LTEGSESLRQKIVKEIADVTNVERANVATVQSPDRRDSFGCESKKAFGVSKK
jgi:hypothetical protein